MRVRLAATLIAGNVLVVLPWQLYVYSQSNEVVPLSSAGPASVRIGLIFAVKPDGYRRPVDVPVDVREVMLNINEKREEMNSVGDVMHVLKEEARKRPWAVVKLFLIRACRAWYGTDSGRHEAAIGAIQAVYVLLMLIALLASWRIGGVHREMVVFASAVVLYFRYMTRFASLSILRYMVPAIGLTFVLYPALCRGPSAPASPAGAD